MNTRIDELLARSRQIEEDIERELQLRRAALHADFQDRRIRFEHEILAQQRRFRTGLMAYVAGACKQTGDPDAPGRHGPASIH
jgi:hypothetical protein